MKTLTVLEVKDINGKLMELNPHSTCLAEKELALKFTTVKTLLSGVGMTICRTGYGKELKARIKGSPVGHGYFTDQLDDALFTGLHMAKTGNTIQI